MTKGPCIWAISRAGTIIWIYYFGRPFFGHLYYIYSVWSMPGSREEDFLKNCAFSVYDLYANALAQEPLSRSHEINNLGRFFLGHYHNKLSMSDLCSEKIIRFFKEIHQFYTFYPPNYVGVPFGWRIMKFTIQCILPLHVLHTKFGKNWVLSSSWEKDVNAQQTV